MESPGSVWFYAPQVNSGAPAKIDSLDDGQRDIIRE
jgi:hypothetical protein